MLVGHSFEIFHIFRCLIYCKGTDFLLIMQIVWCFCGILIGVFVAFHLVFLWYSFKNRDSPGVAELNLRHQGNPYLSLDGAGPSGVISVPGLPKCASIGRVRVARGSNLSIFRP